MATAVVLSGGGGSQLSRRACSGPPPLGAAHFAEHADIRPFPLCPLSGSSVDSQHDALLVEPTRTATGRWLGEGGTRPAHPKRFMSRRGRDISMNSVRTPRCGGQAA
jgi:hypothetical protein